jgi:hypothetical protein
MGPIPHSDGNFRILLQIVGLGRRGNALYMYQRKAIRHWFLPGPRNLAWYCIIQYGKREDFRCTSQEPTGTWLLIGVS